MGPLESPQERVILGIAHALFMNRLHLLRLTEIVRLHIEPDEEDAQMVLPTDLDNDLKQQAVDYVLTCFPEEWAVVIDQIKSEWLQPA
ncbi:MAG: hypothetical protein MJE77_04400 [Proteobacteria bacterium]|nr:hypothetical protein [Pseudomonadota bacterium]